MSGASRGSRRSGDFRSAEAKAHAAAFKLDTADPLTKFWHAVDQIPERRPVRKLVRTPNSNMKTFCLHETLSQFSWIKTNRSPIVAIEKYNISSAEFKVFSQALKNDIIEGVFNTR